ncbi:MAG: hypothetical protein AB7E36_06910 [Salinivirgaceae bacterium]
MSGGFFEYDQYRIGRMADSIEQELKNQGKKKPKDDLWGTEDYYEKYPEDRFYPTYTALVQEKLREAVNALRQAEIYAHRVDWFLSGDDGEDNFPERLSSDLEEFMKSKKYLKTK